MNTHEQTRRAHRIVDALKGGAILSSLDVDFLRSFLPEPPKQKTLREIAEHVRDAWARTIGNNWDGNSYNTDISNEDWLRELFEQLRGLNDAPAATPALPAGMRLADHEEHGRVVTIGWLDDKGDHFCVFYDKDYGHGIYSLLKTDSLTFIDAEPAKPAHPEFLETEADYRKAPEGTVAAKDGGRAWLKREDGDWASGDCSGRGSDWLQGGSRRVLRWGWGK